MSSIALVVVRNCSLLDFVRQISGHIGNDRVCRGSKLRDYVLEGYRGLEIFARDLVLAVIDDWETTDKSTIHVKYYGLWPSLVVRDFFLLRL